LRRGLSIVGPVGLGAAANVLVGMIEAALLIRPHLATMSRVDLFAMMNCGLTTIVGTVPVLYATIPATRYRMSRVFSWFPPRSAHRRPWWWHES
jgi:CNT family concentrative nucleoside transporter